MTAISDNPVPTSRLSQEPDLQDLNAEYNLMYDGKSYQPVTRCGKTETLSKQIDDTHCTTLPQNDHAVSEVRIKPDRGIQQPFHVGSLTHTTGGHGDVGKSFRVTLPAKFEGMGSKSEKEEHGEPYGEPKVSHPHKMAANNHRGNMGEVNTYTPSTQESENQDQALENYTPTRNPRRRELNTARIVVGVGESKMMGEHVSYHQSITGEDARRRLELCSRHCYLIRYSRTQECYVLSVYKPHEFRDPVIEHFEIVIENSDKHRIKGKAKTFNSIQSLLEHYEQNRIDPALRSIGRAYTEGEYERAEELQRQQEAERQRNEEAERQREEERQGKKVCTIL